MQDMPHHDDVGLGDRSVEEVTLREAQPSGKPVPLNVFFKDRLYFGEIKSNARQMRVGERDLNSQVPLRCAHIHVSLVVFPGKLVGNGQVGAVAETGHGCQELFEPGGTGIERGKERLAATFGLILWTAAAQALGEMVPEAEEPAC